MKEMIIHEKHLPIPSFFQVYNYGGGFGDKTREIVYAELTGNTPALFNYFYICNAYPHMFQSEEFNDISKYARFGDALNAIRDKMIDAQNYKAKDYPRNSFDFNEKVLLLDSGAANIVKYVAKEIGYDAVRFKEEASVHMKRYYDYADKYKFDLVVGFDLGGKYTFKDGETKDKQLITFYDALDKDEINLFLLEETIKYLKEKPDYYPKVFATIHGKTPKAYADYMDKVLLLETNYNYRFWGFALGGIAGSKSVDASWYADIDFKAAGKKYVKDAVAPAKASKIVRALAGERLIHALGCGGYPNIPMNYFCGATSFDAASPARRVGDGNDLSVEYVYMENAPKTKDKKPVSFSKMFVGGYDAEGKRNPQEFDYKRLCDVPDAMKLCGCPACEYIKTVREIKDLYAKKAEEQEAHYLARQLMNAHAVNQHRRLCETVSKYETMEEFCDTEKNALNQKLKLIYEQIKMGTL